MPVEIVERCRSAAEGGHVLKWARAHDCPWDSVVCSAAALRGHLVEVLKWARDQDCPWSENVVLFQTYTCCM
jgi:membrane-associated PAP2 superfamily phosphatase